jgi:hypothetical protein
MAQKTKIKKQAKNKKAWLDKKLKILKNGKTTACKTKAKKIIN